MELMLGLLSVLLWIISLKHLHNWLGLFCSELILFELYVLRSLFPSSLASEAYSRYFNLAYVLVGYFFKSLWYRLRSLIKSMRPRVTQGLNGLCVNVLVNVRVQRVLTFAIKLNRVVGSFIGVIANSCRNNSLSLYVSSFLIKWVLSVLEKLVRRFCVSLNDNKMCLWSERSV